MAIRRAFIAGNWKCNGTRESVQALVAGLNEGANTFGDIDAAVAPISLHLGAVKATLAAPFHVAAQNCSLTGTGAFTGEISATQLKDFGIEWTILGHSERRAMFGEDNELVGKKVATAQKAGLSVIACIGEQLEDRKSGRTMDVVTAQLKPIAENVADWDKMVLAYEPVWAIGTGEVATPQQAQEVHLGIRSWLRANVSDKVADSIRIQYGGSVKPKNCDALWSKPDIDGFLVGGAALKPADFLCILGAPKRARSSL